MWPINPNGRTKKVNLIGILSEYGSERNLVDIRLICVLRISPIAEAPMAYFAKVLQDLL